MDRISFIKKIISTGDFKGDWGAVCNYIQDVAETVLTNKEWNDYLLTSVADAETCNDMDGVLLNGQYFDWRECYTKIEEITKAYLDYFTDEQLERIENAIATK